jgi:hypothetical protein
MNYEEYYNITFEVKYNEIWKELLNNLTNNNENLSDEEKYSEEEVECICKKLYLDEISSVFKSDDFLDDKVDVGFRKVFEILMKNSDFNQYIIDLTMQYAVDNLEDMKYLSFLSLFDMKIFYLTHQFISHYLKTNEIEPILFEQIKQLNTLFSEK